MAFVLHKPYPVADENLLVEIQIVRPGKKPARALPAAARAFQNMFEAARIEGVSLIIVSAFRSWAQQEICFRDAQARHGNKDAVLWVAPPGHSEHHTGYVFDIGDEKVPQTDDEPGFEKTGAFHWLEQNASKFFFELSFPPGNFGRVSYEPWHWRYVGTSEAMGFFHPSSLKNMTLWAGALLRAIQT